MKITREQQPPPPTEYVLRFDYMDLHSLYHMMLDLSRRPGGLQTTVEQEFFAALREHA